MTRPPTKWLVAYRLFGVRLPEEYRPWVAHDVAQKSFVTWTIGRSLLWLLALVGVYDAVQGSVFDWPAESTVLKQALIVTAIAILPTGKTLVRRALRWQRIDKHGRRTKARGLAVLESVEAVLLAVAVLVTFAGASAVYAYAQRPDPVRGAKCEDPDEATLGLITPGITHTGGKIYLARAVRYRDGQIVAGLLDAPKPDKPGKDTTFEMWLVRDDGQVYSLPASKEATSWTSFGPPPAADRVIGDAYQRIYDCLSAAVKR